ncbi:MAG: hypothetical protein WDM85_18180 [Caulobacteraceae bacterium]
MAQSLGLAANDSFLKAMGAIPKSRTGAKTPAASAGRERWVVGVLQANLGVLPVRDSRLVKITFNSPSPALAAQIANAFADNFIASNLERKFDASSYARQFLEQAAGPDEGQARGLRAAAGRLRHPATDHQRRRARRRQGPAGPAVTRRPPTSAHLTRR